MGVLNACNRFAVPALASTFFNIGSVAFGLILGYVLGPHLGHGADHRHGDRRGAGRRFATGLANAGAARRRIPFPSSYRLEPSPAAQNLQPDGPRHPRQRRGSNQRAGHHQLRFAHSRQRSGELAGLFVPLHAASAGTVRRRHRIRHASFHLAQRGHRQFRRIPPHALQIARHGFSADAAVFGGPDRVGPHHDWRHLSGRQVQRLRHRSKPRSRSPVTLLAWPDTPRSKC